MRPATYPGDALAAALRDLTNSDLAQLLTLMPRQVLLKCAHADVMVRMLRRMMIDDMAGGLKCAYYLFSRK